MKSCRGVNHGSNKALPEYSFRPEDIKYWEIDPEYVKEPINKSQLLMS